MFWIERNDIGIICNLRCGHTSFYKKFGMAKEDLIYDLDFSYLMDWFESVTTRVVVLRHPVQRMQSALRWNNFNRRNSENCDETSPIWELVKEFTHDDREEQLLRHYILHCNFYFDKIKHLDFKIIPFENLGEYLDVRESFPTYSRSYEPTDDMFNDVITREGLEKELELYEKFRKYPIFPIEDFKNLV